MGAVRSRLFGSFNYNISVVGEIDPVAQEIEIVRKNIFKLSQNVFYDKIPARMKLRFNQTGAGIFLISEDKQRVVKEHLLDNCLRIPYRGCTLCRFLSFWNCQSHLRS